jgi:hypothetical protein
VIEGVEGVAGVAGVQELQEFRSSAVPVEVSILSSRVPLSCRIFEVMYSVASGYSELLNS